MWNEAYQHAETTKKGRNLLMVQNAITEDEKNPVLAIEPAHQSRAIFSEANTAKASTSSV